MNEVLVIIPTYNESENIIKIIESIFIIHPDINVLVVDDNSPDGTSSKVKEVIPKFKGNLDLITRSSKLGLGTAYLCGFEWAMNKDYDFIIIKEESFRNQSCYLLQSKPKNGIKSEYSRHLTWITKDSYLPLKEESYDNKNKLLKMKEFKYILMDSFNLVNEIFVENIQKKSNTRLTLSNLRINTNVKDNLFQEKNMKRLPRK